MISEEQAREYEASKSNLLINCIHLCFPRYFNWLFKRRYRRYKGFMDYKKSQILKRLKTIQSLKIYN